VIGHGRALRRMVLLVTLAAALGVAGGGAAWLLVRLIGIITNLALFHRWGTHLPSFSDFHPDWTLFVAAAAGGAIVALFARWAPVIRGHGIPEAMEAVLTRQSRISPRAALAKPLTSAVAIGTGGPFGAEGPIIVTGGALGSLVGQVLRVSPAERKILLASGAAAGMAAVFGSPLAAVVLAIELLLFEFSSRALMPLVVATSVAGGMHALLFSSGPIFTVPVHHFSGLDELPMFAVLGLACGLLAVVVCRGLFAVEAVFRRLPLPVGLHPVIGALAFATVGLLVPRALGVGYDAIDDVLANRLALGTLVVLLLGKLVAWWLALGSGTSGGTLAPILLIGGCFGGVFAALVAAVQPGVAVSSGAIVLVAMAATFGAATRATFTSIVFAFELTHDYDAVLPLMVATVVAELVARALLDHDLMTEKLVRRGLEVPRSYEPDVLGSTRVRNAMTAPVQVLSASATIAEARAYAASGGHGAYPLVDPTGRCVGIVTRTDLLVDGVDPDAPVTAVASADVVSVGPEDLLVEVIERIVDERVSHLPVLDEAGHLLGICTRTDVLRVSAGRRETEHPQPGWLRSLRRSTSKPRRRFDAGGDKGIESQ
jgi:chloride channel protein, CIC family